MIASLGDSRMSFISSNSLVLAIFALSMFSLILFYKLALLFGIGISRYSFRYSSFSSR